MNSEHCEQLDDYLLKDLDPDETAAFGRHLAVCEACRLVVEHDAHLDQLLRAAAQAVSCPPGLASAVRREIGRRSHRRLAVTASLFAASLVVGLFLWSMVKTPPQNQNEIAEKPFQPTRLIEPLDSDPDGDSPKVTQAEPRSPVRVEFSEDVLSLPIDTGDPDITLIQLYPVSNVTQTTN